MLTKVSLSRFRGFKLLEAQTRLITVVLGPNSSGKTSLLHAIRVAIEALSIGLEEWVPHLDDDGWITVCRDLIIWDHARLFPAEDWAELFTDKQVDAKTSMSLALTFDETDVFQSVEVELAYARNQQLKVNVRVRSQRAIDAVADTPKKSKYRSELINTVLAGGLPRAVFVPAFYGVTGAEEYRTRPLVERLLSGGEQSRIVRNFIARMSGESFNRLNDFLARHLGARLVERTTDRDAERVRHLRVTFQDTNGELELASAGAGLVNLIALYAALEMFRPQERAGLEARPVIYLLDEPEAHLHPRLQGGIGEALGTLASEFKAQFIIATHSIEMINRLGQRQDAVLLAVDRREARAASLDSEDALIQELSRWCDLTPFTSINFLASRRILFHEGPSDAEFLKICAGIYFRNRPADMSAFGRWTFVPLGGVGNLRAQGVLGAVLTPKIFPELATGASVRAVCVMDRDAQREPGFRRLEQFSQGPFGAHELVWSRYSIESLFLDAPTLAAWVALALKPGEEVAEHMLRQLVEEGLKRADADVALTLGAQRSLLMPRINEGKKILTAFDSALQEAQAQPAVWQNGKERAQEILQYVRERLPEAAAKSHLSTSLLEVLRKGAAKKLGDREVLVPKEIQQLLEYMAASGVGTPV